MSSTWICLLLTCTSLIISILGDRDVPVLHLTVQVGEKVDFVCNLKDTITPVDWVINQTKYNFNRLPDDYSISLKDEFLILVIDESQLWMNNTLYQCYDNDMGEESDMGLLYVKFHFEGPQDTEALLGDNVFISCKSIFLTENNLSVVWNIDGDYYNPTRLSDTYLQKEDGLYIPDITETLDGTTFQCLFRSNKLWKNDYYHSNIATLRILSNDSKMLHQVNVTMRKLMKTFKFNHQGFFLGNKFTISWNEAENCPENFNYYLVKTFDNIPDNKTNLQKRKNVTLSREEVIVDNDNNKYQIYILASEDGIEICATSETYIQLTPGVHTTSVCVETESDKCFSHTNLHVLWSFSPRGEDYCICDDWNYLSDCDCINSTIYEVNGSTPGKICWENLEAVMNRTKIFFVNETTHFIEDWLPYVSRNYLLSYEIIIIGYPGIPSVYNYSRNNDGDFQLYIEDIYTGHSPIIKYYVNVTDITKNFLVYVSNKEKPEDINAVITLPKDLTDIMSSACGPQTLSVTSANVYGISLPVVINLPIDKEDVCECILKTIKFNLKEMNVSSNSIHVKVICETEYDNSESINFEFTLEPKDIQSKSANCSQEIAFYGLKSGVKYEIYAQWRRCTFGMAGKFQTNEYAITSVILGGSIGGSFIFVVIIAIVIQMIVIVIFKRILKTVNLNDVLNTRYSDASLPRNCFHQAPCGGLYLWSNSHIHIST